MKLSRILKFCLYTGCVHIFYVISLSVSYCFLQILYITFCNLLSINKCLQQMYHLKLPTGYAAEFRFCFVFFLFSIFHLHLSVYRVSVRILYSILSPHKSSVSCAPQCSLFPSTHWSPLTFYFG